MKVWAVVFLLSLHRLVLVVLECLLVHSHVLILTVFKWVGFLALLTPVVIALLFTVMMNWLMACLRPVVIVEELIHHMSFSMTIDLLVLVILVRSISVVV